MKSTFAAATLLAALTLTQAAPVPTSTPEPKVGTPFVAKTYDGSTVNLELTDDSVEVATKYGNLKVPTNEIKKIEFRTRCPAKLEQQISEWTGKLGHDDFKTREDATNNLKLTGERAYHAASKAAKSSDPEVSRRGGEAATWIRAKHNINTKSHDTLTTIDGSVINGNVTAEYLNVNTPTFGKQELKLYDIRTLSNDKIPNSVAIPAPQNLSQTYAKKFGTVVTFKITIAEPGVNTNGVWGSGPYALDSNLNYTVIHAGLGKPGETIEFTVRIIESPAGFQATEANGIKSQAYGFYEPGAFEFIR